jgi:hypothetical protein
MRVVLTEDVDVLRRTAFTPQRRRIAAWRMRHSALVLAQVTAKTTRVPPVLALAMSQILHTRRLVANCGRIAFGAAG